MANLSKLEQATLKELIKEMNTIKTSYYKNSDSIEDALCEQVTVQSSDPAALAVAMEHFRASNDSLSRAFCKLELIEDHFLPTGK